MEVILKEDLSNLGHAGDLVKVKNGYANNYLVPKGFAIIATSSAKKVHAENVKQRAHKEERLRNQALELAEQIKNKEIKIGAKTN